MLIKLKVEILTYVETTALSVPWLYNTLHNYKIPFFLPTNAPFIEHIKHSIKGAFIHFICSIKGAFVGKKRNFDVINHVKLIEA